MSRPVESAFYRAVNIPLAGASTASNIGDFPSTKRVGGSRRSAGIFEMPRFHIGHGRIIDRRHAAGTELAFHAIAAGEISGQS
jgi:hypothetical protein